MVVQTRGDEPKKEEKSWAEQYAPWLVAAGLIGGGLAVGAHYDTKRVEPTIELIFEAPHQGAVGTPLSAHYPWLKNRNPVTPKPFKMPSYNLGEFE